MHGRTRRTAPALLALALLVTVGHPAGAAGAPAGAGKPTGATGPNPYLATGVPDPAGAAKAAAGVAFGIDGRPTTPELAAWQYRLARESVAGAQARHGGGDGTLVYTEREPSTVRGRNDTRPEHIRDAGSGKREKGQLTINGVLASEDAAPAAIAPNAEDDGAIPLAGTIPGRAATTSGTIGDGPHGSAGTGTGDFDFYEVTGAAGDVITVDVDVTGDLDTVALLYDAAGTLLGGNDDQVPGSDFSSRYSVALPAAGTYYVAVGGWSLDGITPADPNDPASGPGAGSEGPYTLLVRLADEDADAFTVDLDKGDVLGITVTGGAAGVDVYDPSGALVFGSPGDIGGSIYPAATRLPFGGNATADHVAATGGRHRVVIRSGIGAYSASALITRPPAELAPRGTRQTLLLDFDGATLDPAIFNAGAEPGERAVTPLTEFLPAWGLTEADLPALLDEVKETVNRQFALARRDARAPELGITVVTSADGPEAWGQTDVSRVIIGGTRAEIDIPTVGIAQSIDPGNFAREETAIVLLDLLSAPAEVSPISLNRYLTPASDRIGFIGRVLGTLVAHEAGHYLGNWHTNRDDDLHNVMDQGGGNVPFFLGVGPDGVGGTADDEFSTYGPGPFAPSEGIQGTENTAVRTAWALVRG